MLDLGRVVFLVRTGTTLSFYLFIIPNPLVSIIGMIRPIGYTDRSGFSLSILVIFWNGSYYKTSNVYTNAREEIP